MRLLVNPTLLAALLRFVAVPPSHWAAATELEVRLRARARVRVRVGVRVRVRVVMVAWQP